MNALPGFVAHLSGWLKVDPMDSGLSVMKVIREQSILAYIIVGETITLFRCDPDMCLCGVFTADATTQDLIDAYESNHEIVRG
jgi:hypothetical protein